MTAAVGRRRLRVVTEVRASAATAVPIAFGWHPYWRVPGSRDGWLLALPEVAHLRLDRHGIPTGRARRGTGRRGTAGRSGPGRPVRAHVVERGDADRRRATSRDRTRRRLPVLPGFAPLRRSFCAIEPMTAPTNALVRGDHPTLAPGARFAARLHRDGARGRRPPVRPEWAGTPQGPPLRCARRAPRRVLRAFRDVHRGGAPQPARPRGRRAAPDHADPRRHRRGRARSRRPRVRPDRELDRGLGLGHPRHPRVRERPADPARGGPADLDGALREARDHARRTCSTVLSFPIAAAQCRKWLQRKRLPTAAFVAANSTADAAATVARSKRADQAAIGNTARRGAARPEGARRRHRGPPREPDALRRRRPRDPGADRSRQDDDRLLPARRPAGIAPRDAPGVRGPRRST